MESRLLIAIVMLLVVILNTVCVSSIDMESAKEMPCFTPDKSRLVNVDFNWVLSLNRMYYPYMSRFDLYISSVDQSGLNPKDLTEDTVYYDGCITWKPEPDAGGYLQDGFGIKNRKYLIKQQDPDTGAVPFSNSDGGYNGMSYTTLTDNKTYLVSLNCYTDWDQITWSVTGPIKTLGKETVQLIHEHVQSFGFKREQFTGLRYDGCA